MTLPSPHPSPQVIFSSVGRGWKGLNAAFLHIPGGLSSHVRDSELHRLGMHFGPPVRADCLVAGRRVQRLQKPGDIDFVPAGVDGSWRDDADCQILRLEFRQSLLEEVADALGRDSANLEMIPRLQLRDARIEALGWAIKADLEADTPSDALYIDLLANALAVRLIEIAIDSHPHDERLDAPKLSARQLRILTDYIEANLSRKLYLADLALVAGVSATRLKTLFRNSIGTSVHQYVIGRRVEYARVLIGTTTMPASEIALATGFAHQSHMTSTMRRILGQTPGEIVRLPREM